MTYQVLARKWRPKSFNDMVGQEPVLRALINGLNQGRLHHAYLFTGTRGVGKTTLARIIAKCLNCSEKISAEPCGQCSNCLAIDEGRFIDLLEIDAASRTKVEDTREILDNVPFAPTQGRYKVYLIDEVHMLSGHSFNALLKTLEEPPEHVKFLLATTDPQKLPITILSRCLQFNLKALSPELIAARLVYILQQEQINYAAEALELLAHAANGSMRDALSLLDQAIAFGNGQVQVADVKQMLGTIDQSYMLQIMQALMKRDAAELLSVCQNIAEQSLDFAKVLEELLFFLHRIAINQAVPNFNHSNTHYAEQIANLAQQLAPEEVQLYYQIALIGRRDLALAPSPKSGFEMIVLRMLNFAPAETPVKPVKENSATKIEPNKTPPKSSAAEPIEIPTPKAKSGAIEIAQTPPALSFQEYDTWADILLKLNLSGLAQTLAMNCVLLEKTEHAMSLALDGNQSALLNPTMTQLIETALQNLFQKSIKLTITLATDPITSPAKQKEKAQIEHVQQTVAAIENDSNIQSLLKTFDAKIQHQSVKLMSSSIEE